MNQEFGEDIVSVFEASWPNLDDIQRAQLADSVIKEIISLLSDNSQPDFRTTFKAFRTVWRKLVVINGILFKRAFGRDVVVVPESLVDKVLRCSHGNPISAHYGVSKTYYKLISRFYFPYMITRLTDHINKCEPCLKRKMPRKEPKPEIQPLGMEGENLEIGACISYDFKGPLPVADKTALYQCKNRFVLVIIDHATRYVLAYPTPSMDARVVSEIILSHWIPRFGVPRYVISDRAKTFTGKVMSTIYKALQIEIRLTASYNPACNGLVEQVNRNISSLLMVMVEDKIDEWPKHLNLLFSAYNASPHSTTGYSPNFLVYGRELIEPLDTIIRTDGITGKKERGVLQDLEERLKVRRRALELIELKYKEASEKVVDRSRRTACGEKFEVGEIVGFKAPPGSNKLFKSFEINHEVIKILSADTYILRNKDTGFERVVNARKMRKLNKETSPQKGQLQSGFSDEEDAWNGNDEGGDSEVGDPEDKILEPEGTKSVRPTERPGVEAGLTEDDGSREVQQWGPRLRIRKNISKPDRLGY